MTTKAEKYMLLGAGIAALALRNGLTGARPCRLLAQDAGTAHDPKNGQFTSGQTAPERKKGPAGKPRIQMTTPEWRAANRKEADAERKKLPSQPHETRAQKYPSEWNTGYMSHTLASHNEKQARAEGNHALADAHKKTAEASARYLHHVSTAKLGDRDVDRLIGEMNDASNKASTLQGNHNRKFENVTMSGTGKTAKDSANSATLQQLGAVVNKLLACRAKKAMDAGTAHDPKNGQFTSTSGNTTLSLKNSKEKGTQEIHHEGKPIGRLKSTQEMNWIRPSNGSRVATKMRKETNYHAEHAATGKAAFGNSHRYNKKKEDVLRKIADWHEEHLKGLAKS